MSCSKEQKFAKNYNKSTLTALCLEFYAIAKIGESPRGRIFGSCLFYSLKAN